MKIRNKFPNGLGTLGAWRWEKGISMNLTRKKCHYFLSVEHDDNGHILILLNQDELSELGIKVKYLNQEEYNDNP